eukprot:TRINITY_DN4788_c0_g2_i1.p1 TRINITY_DN4788_c0_g2~~TRINITY_DN4788_c0_g2_i1.p1  ORF type:complete len:188 (+),score=61.54 TRINITY_DN4788_c0_g2_i1:44-607(+)
MLHQIITGKSISSEQRQELEQDLMKERENLASGNVSEWDDQKKNWKFPLSVLTSHELALKVGQTVEISTKTGNSVEIRSALMEMMDHLATQHHGAQMTRFYFCMFDAITKLCLCVGEMDLAMEMMDRMDLTHDMTPDHQTMYAHLKSLFVDPAAQRGFVALHPNVAEMVISDDDATSTSPSEVEHRH